MSESAAGFDRFNIHPDFHACMHEAGHVVAARAFGLPVAWVSMDPEFMATDPLAIENGKAGLDHPTSMVLAADLINPILKRGFTASAEERKLIRAYCIETLAGPLAEERLNPLFEPEVGAADYAQVGLVLERIEGDKSKRRRKLNGFVKEAQAFIDENGARIMAFASALYTHRTIKSDEIDRLLNEPSGPISLPPLSLG